MILCNEFFLYKKCTVIDTTLVSENLHFALPKKI